MSDEQLKLFGEVGIGYSQLKQDAENISNLFKGMDKDAKSFGDTMKHLSKGKNDIKNVFSNDMVSNLKNVSQMQEELSRKLIQNASNLNDKKIKSNKIDKASIEQLNKYRQQLIKFNDEWAKFSSKDRSYSVKDLKDGFQVVRKYRDEVGKLHNDYINLKIAQDKLSLENFNKKINSNKSAYDTSYLNEMAKERRKLFESEKASIQNLKNAKLNVSDIKDGVKVVKQYTNSLGESIKEQAYYTQTSKGLVLSNKKISQSFNQAEQGLASFKSQLGNRAKSMASTAIIGGAVGSVVLGMKEVYSINKEFQTQQTDIRRITNFNKREMLDLQKMSFEVGKQTAKDIFDIQEMENLWIRTGHSKLEDLKTLTKSTAVAMNVAKFESAGKAVQYLNATINQLANGDVSKAQEIVDSWSKMADTTAIRSATDLAEIVSRSGSQAKQLKMDIHEVNAVSAIAQEHMAISGDVLGTQLKSLFSRIQQKGVVEKLKKFNIEVVKTAKNGKNEFKSFNEIMKDVNRRYTELMKQGREFEASQIMESIGGMRQRALAINLTEHWDKFDKYVQNSKDSKGFAEKQNAIKLKDLKQQLQVAKVAFQEFAVAIGNAGLIPILTGIAKGGASILNLFNSLPEPIKKSTISILTLVGAYKALSHSPLKIGSFLSGLGKIDGEGQIVKAQSFLSIYKNIRKEMKATREASKGTTSLLNSVGMGFGNVFTAGVKKGESSLKGLKATIAGLSAGFMEMLPLIAVVGTALGAIYIGKKLYDKHKERQQNITDIANGDFDKKEQKQEDSYKEFIKQKNIFDKQNANSDTLKYNEDLAKSVKEVGEALGIESGNALNSKQALESYNDVIRETILLKRIENKEKREKAKDDANARKLTDIQNLNSAYQSLYYAKEKLANKEFGTRGYIKAEKELAKLMAKYSEVRQKVEEDEALLGEKLMDRVKHKNSTKDLEKSLGLDKLYADNGIIDDTTKSVEGLSNALENIHTPEDFINSEMFKDATSEIDKLIGELNTLQSVMGDYANSGKLTSDNVYDLISKYPELSNVIRKVGDDYFFTNDAIKTFNELQDNKNNSIDELLNTSQSAFGSMELNKPELQFDFSGALEQINNIKEGLSSISEENIETYGLDNFITKLADIRNQVENNSITFGDYIAGMNSAIDSIDFSNITDGKDLQTVYDTLTTSIGGAITELNRLKETNQISLSEYASGMTSLVGQINNVLGKVGSFSTSTNAELATIGQTALNMSQDIDTSMQSLSNMDGVLALLSDYGSIIGGSFDDIGNSARQNAESSGLSWGNFADEFSNAMSTIQNTDPTLFNEIAQSISESTGMALEDVKAQIVDVTSPLLSSASSFSGALQGIVGGFSSSIGQMSSTVGRSVSSMNNQLKSVNGNITGTAKQVGMTTLKTTVDTQNMTGDKPSMTFNIPNFQYDIKNNVKGSSSSGGSSNSGSISLSPISMPTLSSISGTGKTLFDFSGLSPKGNKNNNNGYTYIPKNSSSNLATKDDVANLLKNFNNNKGDGKHRNHRGGGGGGRGRKGKGGGGGGKSANKDSIPEQLQKLIEELEHQVNTGKIDDYAMARKLNSAIKDYKGKLTDKVTKQLREKLFNLRTGGSGTRFSEEVKDIKDTMSYLDSEIALLSKEEELSKAINDNKNTRLGNEARKVDILQQKLNSHKELVKKYEGLLSQVNNELNSLDKNTKTYTQDVVDLTKAKQNIIMKLNQEKIALMDNSKAQIEAVRAIQRARQDSYNQAHGKLAKIQSSIVEFINQRNNQIKNSINENYQAKIKSLDRQYKYEDDRFRERKEKYQKELDAFREMIQGKIDALNNQYKEDDYKKDLAKEVDEYNKIQKEIDVRKLDDTYSSKSKVIKLAEELAKKKEQIADMQIRHERDSVIKGLQDQLDEHNKKNKDKLDLMDKEHERFREHRDSEREMLQEAHEAEMKSMEERAKARYVYAEARRAILSGYVQDVHGASISIKDAMIQVAEESGEAFGIFAEETRNELEELAQQVRNLLEMIGHANNKANSLLQKTLGLTSSGYNSFLGENRFGMSNSDFETYMSNKLRYGSASASERARLNKENANIRKKYNITKDEFSFNDLRRDSMGYDHIGNLNGSQIRGLTAKDANDWINAKLNWLDAKNTNEKKRWANIGKNIRKRNNIPDSADVGITDIFDADFSKYTNIKPPTIDFPTLSMPSYKGKISNSFDNSNYRINNVVNINGYSDPAGLIRKEGLNMSRDTSDNLREVLERAGLGR